MLTGRSGCSELAMMVLETGHHDAPLIQRAVWPDLRLLDALSVTRQTVSY